MRIWFQKHTTTGRIPGLDACYESHCQGLAREGTRITFEGLPEQTYDTPLPEALVRFGGVEDFFAMYFATKAVQAEREGYDAFIVGTSQDPGLLTARALVTIPVVGYGETAMHFASMMAPRFGIVGFIPDLEEPLRENAARYGFHGRLVSCTYTSTGPDAVQAALEGTAGPFLESFHKAAREAISAGADVLIPGEGLPNEILVREGVWSVDGVPVLDPDGLVVKLAELLVELRARGCGSTVVTGYRGRRLPRPQLDHLLALYEPHVTHANEQRLG